MVCTGPNQCGPLFPVPQMLATDQPTHPAPCCAYWGRQEGHSVQASEVDVKLKAVQGKSSLISKADWDAAEQVSRGPLTAAGRHSQVIVSCHTAAQ